MKIEIKNKLEGKYKFSLYNLFFFLFFIGLSWFYYPCHELTWVDPSVFGSFLIDFVFNFIL